MLGAVWVPAVAAALGARAARVGPWEGVRSGTLLPARPFTGPVGLVVVHAVAAPRSSPTHAQKQAEASTPAAAPGSYAPREAAARKRAVGEGGFARAGGERAPVARERVRNSGGRGEEIN
jgi:hypothetical protein